MHTLRLGEVNTVLCLGAHCDDIEIGCGGTMLRLLGQSPGVTAHWVVFSADDARAAEATASAQRFLAAAATRNIEIHRFRDGFLPYDGARVKAYFEELKRRIDPDVIFTHHSDDMHQDHRLVNELTWNTFRDHMILQYEIPKYDGDMGRPNLYVHLEPSQYEEKVKILMECFDSQRGKAWFSKELFMGLMRIRGMESNAPANHAEGFFARKVCL